MIFVIVGALVVGLSLGVFGSGGSILSVPVLVYLLDHNDKTAIVESLAIVGTIALVSALPYARAKLVHWRTAVLFGLPGMAGAYLGAWLAAFVAGYVQLFVFAAVMLLAAAQMWRRARQSDPNDPAQEPSKQSILKVAAEGLAVGALTGFVGVGGGFLIVPALVLLGGMNMRRAVGTSLVIIALNSGAGFWKHFEVLTRAGTFVDWTTIGTFVCLGVVGSLAGKSLNNRIKLQALQRGFAMFLVVMAGFIAIKESTALMTPSAEEQPAPVSQ